MQKVEKGFYYHYKHKEENSIFDYVYEVIGIGRNTEEGTFTVLYRPIYENDWLSPVDYQSRPLSMFVEEVEKDGKKMKRFQKIEDKEIIEKLKIKREEMYGEDGR